MPLPNVPLVGLAAFILIGLIVVTMGDFPDKEERRGFALSWVAAGAFFTFSIVIYALAGAL